MARPQSPDYDQKRAAILAAAAALFAKRGFAGTSVADIAGACGASKSLIYHYFPAKDDMLHAVMAVHLDALVAAAEAAEDQADPAARLRALARAFLALYAGAGDSHKVLLNGLDDLSPDRRAALVARQRRIIAVVTRQIAAHRSGDGGRDATAMAMLFFGALNWTHNWLDPEGPLSPDAVADRAVAMLLGGLAATQSSAR